MAKYLTSMIIVLMLTIGAGDAQEPPTCSSEPPPLPTYTEFDPDAVDYAGFGMTDEELTPWPPEPGVVERDGGVEYTYTDVGKLYTHECSDKKSYWFEEDQWVKKSFAEGCWKREPVRISSCQ